MSDDKRNKLREALAFDPTPMIDTEAALLQKHASKMKADDFSQQFTTSMQTQQSTNVDGLRAAIEGSDYNESLSQTYNDEWEKNYLLNQSGYQARVEAYKTLGEDIQKEIENGGYFDLEAGTFLSPASGGLELPSIQRVGNDGRFILERYGSEEGALRGYYEDASAASAGVFGRGGMAQTDMAMNLWADGAVGELIQNYSGWEQLDPRERFSDMAIYDEAEGIGMLFRDFGSAILDLGRMLPGGAAPKVLGVDTLFDSSMTKALEAEDPAFRTWADAVVKDLPRLANLEPSDESALPGLKKLVTKYGSEEVGNLLANAKNADALVFGLNRLGDQKRMYDYTKHNTFSTMASVKMLAHGFQTDPTMALDVGVGLGLAAAGAVTGAAPLMGAGAYLALARSGAKLTKAYTTGRRLSRALNAIKNTGAKTGVGLSKAGKVMVNARRVLPSQVFSELVFPSLKYMRVAKNQNVTGKAWARGMFDYVTTDAQFVNKGWANKSLTRAWQNGLEGGIQGFGDYFVMHSHEKSIIEATYGQEAADKFDFDYAGLGMMTGAGLVMGGVMGSGMGALFDGVGAIPSGKLAAILDGKWSKGFKGFMSDTASMWNGYRAHQQKAAISRKLSKMGHNVSELELDRAIDTHLVNMTNEGMDVNYGIRMALKDLKNSDTELNVAKFTKEIRRHADTRRKAFHSVTGIARTPNTDAAVRVLSGYQIGLKADDIKKIKATKAEEVDAKSRPLEEPKLPEAQQQRRDKNTKNLAEARKRAAATRQNVQDAQALRKESGKGDRATARGLDRDAVRANEEARLEVQRYEAEARDLDVEEADFLNHAAIEDLAGRELEVLARLYHLNRADVEARLGPKGSGAAGSMLGNIHAILDGKADDATVSTAAMRQLFRDEELFSVMIGKQTLDSVLTGRHLTAARARDIVKQARQQLLDNAEMTQVSDDLVQLEQLGRMLGSDDEARTMMDSISNLQELAMQRRNGSGTAETSGFDSASREQLLKEIDEEDPKVVRAIVEEKVDEQKEAIIEKSVERRMFADPEAADLEARKEKLDLVDPKRIVIDKRLAEIREKHTTQLGKEWPATRKNIVEEMMRQHDVTIRGSEAHVGPLVGIINRLRLEASRGDAARLAEDGSLEFALRRERVLAMIPQEYRFLINTLDNARNADGTYDMEAVISHLLHRVARADEDMARLIRGGAELRALALRNNEGIDSLELTDTHLSALAEAQRKNAQIAYRQSGQYAGGGGRADWDAEFHGAFDERAAARLMKNPQHFRDVAASYDVELPEGTLSLTQVKAAAREIYRRAGALQEFSDLGGGENARAYMTPAEAAYTIIESLESPKRADGALDNEGRFKMKEGSRDVVESSRPDVAARLARRDKMDPSRAKRLGNISHNMTRRLFEQSRTNDRVTYLLFDENGNMRSDEDLERIYEWLKGLTDEQLSDTEMHGTASGSKSFRLAPPSWIAAASDRVATDVDGWIDGVAKSLLENPPAMIATIHDAIDSALPGMFGALYGKRNTDTAPFYGVTDSGFSSAQGVFGLGLGFRTLHARPGSLADSMNTAFELTVGVRGFAKRARQEFGKNLAPELERLGLIAPGEELTDATILGAVARGLSQDDTKAEVGKLFFPEAQYLDADASGANILMANIRVEDLRRALDSDQDIRTIAEGEAQRLGRDGFDSGQKADLYNITKDLTIDVLNDPAKLSAILSDLETKGATPEALESWTAGLRIWKRILNDDVLAPELRDGLFKGPVMTDLYQIGAESMTDDIVNGFFGGGKLSPDGLARLREILGEEDMGPLSADLTGTNVRRNQDTRVLASKLAHLLHSSREHVEGSLIKQAVFGKAHLTNEKIGEAILKVRDQQVQGVSRNASDILNNPAEADAIARGMIGIGGKERLNAHEQADLAVATMLVYRAAQESTAPNQREGNIGATFERQLDKAQKIIDEAIRAAPETDAQGKLEIARAALQAERMKNQARSDAFNSLANQNLHIDAKKAKALMSILVGDDVANDMFDNLDPLAKQAMISGFFRNLSTSNEGRFFVNTVLDMIGDKSSRIGSIESPIGTAKFFGADGKGMDQKAARRAAIMQLAVNAAEMTGDMPALSGKAHVEMDEQRFLAEWSDLDAIQHRALTGTSVRVPSGGSFDRQLAEFLRNAGLPTDDDTMKAARSHFAKLRKNALSGRTKINDLGEEGAVTRMGPWGMVDPRLNFRSNESVGLASAGRIQMAPALNAELRNLNELDAIADSEFSGPMFSQDEMASSIDEADAAIESESLPAFDSGLTMAMDFGTSGAGALRYRAAVMQATLDRFARQIDTAYARKMQKAGKYDELYVLYRQTMAVKAEYDNLESRSRSEVAELQAYGHALVHGLDGALDSDAEDSVFRGEALRHRARLIGRREVNKSAQWARDLQNAERSILSLEADPTERMLFTGGKTWEDNLARTAQMNPTGQMMSWLFKPADSHGRVLARSGTIGYKDNYVSSRTPLFAQMQDSQFLVATALTDSYTWKRVASDLGIDNLTAERYRQLRAASEFAMGAQEINTTGFDADIARLFSPENIDDTFAKMSQSIDDAKLAMESTDFISDIGATGEGLMLFNESLNETATAQLKAELKAAGKQWADMETAIFNTTIADVNGKKRPTAFVNMFGEVINPHEIVGQARIALTADERVRALNLTRNRPLMDRMRTGAALGLYKTAFEAEVSARMMGYDGEFGAPLKKVRRQAALEAEAVQFLVDSNGKKMRKGATVSELGSRRSFIDIDKYETDEMIAEAKKAAAADRLKQLAPERDSDLVPEHADLMKRLDKSPAMQAAVLLSHMNGEFDRDGILGLLRIEYPEMPLAEVGKFVDEVMVARDDVRGYLNKRLDRTDAAMDADRLVNSSAAAIEESNNLRERQQAAHDAVEGVITADLPPAKTEELLDKLNRRSDTSLHQEPAPSRQDALADESIDPRTIDDGRVHNKMLKLKDMGGAHARLDTVFQTLENRKVLTKEERLLLDATFSTIDEDLVAATFYDADFSTEGMAGAGRMRAWVDVDRVVQRIELAKDIHTKVNGNAKFGAAGVLLEEVGHLMDLRMRASNPGYWQATIKSVDVDAMQPVLREVFGELDDNTVLSEAMARGYAAVMLNKGAKEILRNSPVEVRQWFGEANAEALSKIAALEDHASFRDFKSNTYKGLMFQLNYMKPLDVQRSLKTFLGNEGRTSPETAIEMHNSQNATSRELAAQDRVVYERHIGDDGRLDAVALSETLSGDQGWRDTIIANDIEAQLEIIGGGAEVTTALGNIIMNKLGKFGRVHGRKILHNVRAAMAPAALQAKAFDAAYGIHGEMSTAMRGLFSILSPTETMSMGGFSTLGGRRVPTLQGLMGEIRGRWDGPMETLYLLRQGDLGSDDFLDISGAIQRSLMEGSDSALDSIKDPNMRELALEVRDQIRDTLRLTADDMLEAGMIKTEAEADLWRNGLPLRLKSEAFVGDTAELAHGTLRAHVATQMLESDNIDFRAVEFMKDNEGALLFPYDDNAQFMPAQADALRERGFGELADKVIEVAEGRRASGLSEDWKSIKQELNAMARKGDITKSSLGDDFATSYNRALTDEITGDLAVARANALNMHNGSREVTYTGGFADLKTREYMQRFGTSAYVLYSDPFINARSLMSDPEMKAFIEDDLIKIMDGMMRGPASQALDRAVYGKAFGVRGMGLEDIIEMMERQVNVAGGGRQYAKINKRTGEGQLEADRLSSHDRRLMRDQLSTMKMAIKYAKGTATRADVMETPFFTMLNDAMSLATSAMVAPRYMLGTLVEELPHAALKGYGEFFTGLRGELKGAMIGKSKAERKEILRGITTFIRDLQHDAAVDTRMRGADSSQFIDDEAPIRMLEKMNATVQKVAGIGFKEMTQSIKAQDARASISRLMTMMKPGKNGTSMFDALSELTEYRLEDLRSVGELNEVLREIGIDSSQYTGVREMLRAGLFDVDTSVKVKELMEQFASDHTGNFDFQQAQRWIAQNVADFDTRQEYMVALERIRTMVKIDSIRNAKEPTMENVAIAGGSLQQIMTRLTSYSSMVSSNLRRAALGGGTSVVPQMLLYMASGYLYFKATQLARGKSFERSVTEGWEENPEVELYDMIMSVPFLGFAQMPIAFLLKQAGLGSVLGLDQFSVKGGKAYSLAGVATLNRLINLFAEAPRSVRAMFSEEEQGTLSSTELANGIPVALNWIWAPLLGLASDAMMESKGISAAGFTKEAIQKNPDAYFAWAMRQALDPNGASIDMPSVDARGLVRPAGNGGAARAAQDRAAIMAAKAAHAAAPTQPALPKPGAPVAESSPAPAEPLGNLPSYKPAPKGLK